MNVGLKRVNEAVHFEGTGSSADVKISIDGSPEIGGLGLGVRPMELILMALASCSALDLIVILKKQKQRIDDFRVTADGTRREQAPPVFTSIHLTFMISGQVEQAKADKAAFLAVKKYCSVHDMLSAAGVEITFKVDVNSKCPS